MKFLDAAYTILKEADQPLHYTEIARRGLERRIVSTQGKTPTATMGSRLYVDTKKPVSRFKRVGKGLFTLVEPAQKTDDIAERVQSLNGRTRKEFRKRLHEISAERFEALIGELLIAIGFDEDTIEITSYGNDGGIDVRGILNAGGITSINAAVQAKKWKRNIQRPTVQNVRGALTTHEQGIIITTSGFSKGAHDEAKAVGKTPISLIDGDTLLALLIEHSIGVTKEQHTVLTLDDEWWGELELGEPEPIVQLPHVEQAVIYPVSIRVVGKPDVTATLLDLRGSVLFENTQYRSPSGAGKVASGWKSCNGWTFWEYQDVETGRWVVIDILRKR